MWKVLFVWLFVVLQISSRCYADEGNATVDYCSAELECKKGGQTYKNSGCDCPNIDEAKCGGPPGITKFSETPDLVEEVVEMHNQLRHLLASGGEMRGTNIGATDMMLLEYDKTLEYTAYCHAIKCTDDHDKCRITEKFKSAGQNIHFITKPCNETGVAMGAVKSWYEEINYVKKRSCITRFNCDLKKVGHFTQVVWAKTTHVGCASVFYQKEWRKTTGTCSVYCNYGPAGNWQKQRIYTLGKPGRDCVEKHPVWTSLCVGPIPISGDHEVDDGAEMLDISLVMVISSLCFILIVMPTIYQY